MTQEKKERLFDVAKVEELFKNMTSLEDLTKTGGLLQELSRKTIERILQAEQEIHLGYQPYQKGEMETTNSRNGYSQKTLKTSQGEMTVAIPRDRDGSFDPKFVVKHQRFDPDLQKRVIGLYARGMSVRDIASQLEEFYGTSVSTDLISKITDSVLEDAAQWQSRPLDDVYAVVFLDAIHYKIRQEGKVVSKAAYTCLGINLCGEVDVLGLWLHETEGSHFWMTVLTDLKNRGVSDILIACVDGLKGFPQAIETVFPKTQVQLCIIHQIRTSLRYMASKYHKEFIRDLKEVYKASTLELAEMALLKLEETWSKKYPMSVQGWKNNWSNLSTYFAYPSEIRKMIYTTNAVEAVHRQFRKITKTKGAFPTDDSLRKILYLTTIRMKGTLKSKLGWSQMLAQLKLIFTDRIHDSVL